MLDAVASRAAKERGMQTALDFSGEGWKERVLSELGAWIATQRAQGITQMVMEEFRAVAKNHPHSPAAWGPLAVVACKAGLLVPMTHPDGSPVYRLAQSVKTHRHPIRCYAFASSFSAPAADEARGTLIQPQPGEAANQTNADADVGGLRHSGIGASLLAATSDYHRQRQTMGEQSA